MATDTLTVEFLGERHTVSAGSSLTFGRAADLIIDSHPSLHRVVGQFFHAEDAWWLSNQAKASPLTVSDRSSASMLTIVPGATARLSFPSAEVSFRAAEAKYSFDVDLSFAPPDPPRINLDLDSARPRRNEDGTGAEDPDSPDVRLDLTEQPDAQPLTPEQRLLIAALAEPTLRTGSLTAPPTNRATAARLGWSITKFNRKLDAVCKKLSDGGVTGLLGTQDQLARDRRQRLVEHGVYAQLVSAEDLALLDVPRADAAGPDVALLDMAQQDAPEPG